MVRPQRQVKKGPYIKVNAYSQRVALQQIAIIVIFVLLLVLHSVFIVPSIVHIIKHPVLIFMLALNYLLIFMIAYDYLFLTIKDPVDRLVSLQALVDEQKPNQLKKCITCNKQVFQKSYHCMRCNRCTQNFDHHCKYLNNCIGSRNYENFFRVLVTMTVYLLLLMGQGIWVFVASFYNTQLNQYMINRWPVIAIVLLTIPLIIGIDSLLVFHIYLRVWRGMTTVQYIFRETPSNDQYSSGVTSSMQSQVNIKKDGAKI